MAYASPADVQARLGRPLADSERQLVTTRLDDAERLILTRIPDLAAKVTEGVLDSELVAQVEADAVLRLVRNPEGVQSESDGSYSYTLAERVASGLLEILPDEWALLGVRAGAFTIRPHVDVPFTRWPPDLWWPA
ncbi:hypothetical protein GCM10012275_39190 [Longimycelium tulufanense]|uniref:Phage protein Gp19/Gp15/Gp42 n=1 Tax=Longimycelium tulufanense TaxID=907463 RepID=A0A8J3CAA7_9PSEU|nr:Gp19/Gp15/Gp42 family protein [Longimycelium tulufanense]GGM64772.1 hypothetical protein GCM10012275_39190 [Longimycelium tulufanense]